MATSAPRTIGSESFIGQLSGVSLSRKQDNGAKQQQFRSALATRCQHF